MNHGLNEPGAITLIIQLPPAILNAHFAYLRFNRVVISRANSCVYILQKNCFQGAEVIFHHKTSSYFLEWNMFQNVNLFNSVPKK